MRFRWVGVTALVVLVVTSTPFAVSVGTVQRTDGVPWSETERTGLSQSVLERSQDTTVGIPRAEVFYSRYKYVVGYYGVGTLVADLETSDAREFGRPLSVLVSDYSYTNASVGPGSVLRMSGTYTLPWVNAERAYFVVGSSARLPNGDRAIVPFSKRQDAIRFANQYDGEVVRWRELQQRRSEELGRSQGVWRRTVDGRQTRANSTVGRAKTLLDRPVSVVVGEDAPTLESAVNRAPPNSTVVVPPGRYNISDLRVEKPLTIRGAGTNRTVLVGDRNGSVVRATASRTAIANLSLRGVGPNRTGANESIPSGKLDPDRWDYNMQKVHGYGDAAIVFDGAARSFVSNVRINTTSNGILVRRSPSVVVSNLTHYGTERWQEGFLGVATMGSRIVVQDSRFYGGKVGVFLLRGSGHIVRNTSAEGMMVGVFNLYAGDVLISETRVEDAGFGILLPKRSSGNAVVDSEVWGSDVGVVINGIDNYVADNVVTQNHYGIEIEGHYSLYTRNVIAYNDIGFRGATLLPTNRVYGNDVVANGRAASTSSYNILHVWRGNYWSKAPGVRTTPDGNLLRAYRPTGPVDQLVGRASHAEPVAYSPALSLIRELQRVVPGLRAQGIVDPEPLARPSQPATVAEVRARYNESGVGTDEDPWDYHA